MSKKPDYFESICKKASNRWDQLERDPELAGPWHQLFKQVQSPRHVVSELLQNADDAKASEAIVGIENGQLVFMHNGVDFTKEHFASLCRFGYSNKRSLHTIGFRGIGFKSTFSLGDKVHLTTPTLSVAFNRKRFSEPVWEDISKHPSCTTIKVSIKDKHLEEELKKNLSEWTKSPASLLFFEHLNSLRINGTLVKWEAQGDGPIQNSKWMSLESRPEKRYLLIRSQPQDFPEESLKEINQERMVDEKDSTLPPCTVDIVLGLKGRLYVILPTGVQMDDIPFACNAPFVQDPARVKIKDPETSPTNRWLLKRAGELAASAMRAWVENKDLELEQRAQTYDLLTDVNQEDDSLEGLCAATIKKALDEELGNSKFILTQRGGLAAKEKCQSLPNFLFDVWSPSQINGCFVDGNKSLLTHHISEKNRDKLTNWQWVEKIDIDDVLETLKTVNPPKPDSWHKLIVLWSNLDGHVYSFDYEDEGININIIPTQGKDTLQAANKAVRLGDKKLLSNEEDWDFLSEHLQAMDPNWPRVLTKQRQEARNNGNEAVSRMVEKVYSLLSILELDKSSDANVIINQVAHDFFNQEGCDIEDCIRLAQIAASMDIAVSEQFQYVTKNNIRVSADSIVVVDIKGDLDLFTSKEWVDKNVLHDDYNVMLSCTREQWQNWICSSRSRLFTFIPPEQTDLQFFNRNELEGKLVERAHDEQINVDYKYRTNHFVIKDWVFAEKFWSYWHKLAKDDFNFWGKLMERILTQPKSFWEKALQPVAYQVSLQGTTQRITYDDLIPKWIMDFRDKSCLKDTRGKYREPAELLLRNKDTESLLDVEPFVDADLDNEATHPLLDMLGVRSSPTGPDKLLERLIGLSKADNPPVYEMVKWYNRIDQLANHCSTEELDEIKEAFNSEKIILTQDNTLASAAEVFLSGEAEVSKSSIVHEQVSGLTLWRKVGVADYPTAEKIIEWLNGIQTDAKLSEEELKRVRNVLPRYPQRIWDECGHWLNLANEWTSTENLKYALTMHSLIAWGHLFPAIKRQIAALQILPTQVCDQEPFSSLQLLSKVIEERFEKGKRKLSNPEDKQWLNDVGKYLRRIKIFDKKKLSEPEEAEEKRLRDLGTRLAQTKWQKVSNLATTSYIEHTPVGTSRSVKVLWQGSVLYVEQSASNAKLAKAVPEEISKLFSNSDIKEAIVYCYDRSPQHIQNYWSGNFDLTSKEKVKPIVPGPIVNLPGDPIKGPQQPVGIKGGPDQGGRTGQDKGKNDHTTPGSNDDDPITVPPTQLPQPPKPPKPSLMELFATSALGLEKNGDSSFSHPTKGQVVKAKDSNFHWEYITPDGHTLQFYWCKEHNINNNTTLQLDAAIWSSCEKKPDMHSLILMDEKGKPVHLKGTFLKSMLNYGKLKVHPASYRIEYEL